MRAITLLEVFAYLRQSSILAMLALVAIVGMYILAEPTVIRSQVYDQFVTSQTITAEISFVGTASDVTMSPTIPGLTGGTANGYTQVRVYTNNSTGYNMTMRASSSPAMQGISGGSIRDFSTTTTGYMREPSYNFSSTSANSAGFGYTVYASNTNDVDPSFSHTAGGDCGTGGTTETEGQCWIGASSTAAYTVVNTLSSTEASGASTTILLRTVVMSNPVPPINEDVYFATTTLTAATN